MTKRCFKRMMHLCMPVVLLFLMNVARAQVGQSYWKYNNPKSFGFNVNDISFVDDNNGIAVGDGGGIAKTTDGGATWQYGAFTFIDPSNTVQKPTFNDVHYVTPTIAYAVGSNGLFAKSTDGGLNWVAMDNPYTALGSGSIQAYAVWFTSATTGYIGGTKNVPSGNEAPYLYKTIDGGLTWDSIPAPTGADMLCGDIGSPTINQINALNKTIYAIKFVNGIGYISGSGGSIPGLPFPTAAGSNAVLFWKYQGNTLKDYSISKEKLDTLYTSGTRYGTFTPVSQTYRAMQPINDSVIIMASQNNRCVIRVSTGVNDSTVDRVNAGQYVDGRYELLHYPNYPTLPNTLPNYNMLNMDLAPDGKVYVTTGGAQLGYTNDNGTNWSLTEAFPAPSNLTGTLFSGVAVTPNGKVIAAGSEGAIADSLPGGTWQTTYQNYKIGGGSVNKMEFADCDNGIGVGGFGNIAVTTDGGDTWTDKTIASFEASNVSMYGMSYPAANQLYFTSSNGGVYSSTDQGTTNDIILSVPPLGTTATTLYGMASKGNRIWAMGRRNSPVYQSYLFRSMDAGATWDTILPYPSGSTSSSTNYIFFATPDTGYIIGSRGKVYKTIDAGTTWIDVSPDPSFTSSFSDMAILSKDTIFVCGFSRKVYKSFDGGATWTDVSVNLTNPSQFIGNLGAIIMHDKDNGYVMSNSGTSLLTNDGGATWIPQNAPSTGIFSAAAFIPTTVPPGTPFENRRVIVASTPNHFFEYGNPLSINIQSSEDIVNASCLNNTGGSITINASGGIAPYTYSIDGGSTFQSSNVFSGLAQGMKTITIKEAGCGREVTKDIVVGFTDDLTLAVSNDTTVCAGAPVQLTATSAATTYAWSPSGGLSNAGISNPVATVNNNTTFTVTATLGTCVRTGDIVISIKPNPVVNAGPDKTILIGSQTVLEGSGIANPVTISWDPAASVIAGGSTYNPTVKPSITTTYTMSVINGDGCTSTDNAVVTVIPYCVKVMDAFTPNGDGQNDRWLVTETGSSCTQQISVTVFNRYGNVVYKNDNYQNDWEGTYKGKPVADATYYYVINYRLINGASVTLKGDVTILR